jgi:VanZ family protein
MIRLVCRVALLILVAAITLLSLVPPALRPVTAPHHLEHLLIFAATGLAMALAFPWRWWSGGAALVLFTAAVEAAQLFVPGRHARFSDLLVNLFGAGLGLAIGYWLSRLSRPERRCDEPVR